VEHWQIYGIGIASAVGLITAVSVMATDCKKSISRVYERFDEYKAHMESTHVSKEFFALVHKQLVEDIIEIKGDVKTLLRNGHSKNERT
jgi:hypothetical protein